MQNEVIKDKNETWIDHITRKDSIWFLINQLGYRDYKYGFAQVFLQELNSDLVSPDT